MLDVRCTISEIRTFIINYQLSIFNYQFFCTQHLFSLHHRCVALLYGNNSIVHLIFGYPLLLVHLIAIGYSHISTSAHYHILHSVLKLFTGFAIAAFIAWKLTVINVIAIATATTKTKIPVPILVLY